MTRFWQKATAVPGTEGFAVELDGKPVRLPGGARLLVDSEALAQAVAAEWSLAGEEFSLEEMRLTRLAGTAQERIAPNAEAVAVALARYAESDLLCYHASTPAELARRQRLAWQPWIDWAERRFGARLIITTGVRHVVQDTTSLAVLAAAVAACDAPTLAGLGVLVPALGSLVLGLAVVDEAVSPGQAFQVSILDEIFQADLWGDDPEAMARRAEIDIDIATAARFVQLARA